MVLTLVHDYLTILKLLRLKTGKKTANIHMKFLHEDNSQKFT